MLRSMSDSESLEVFQRIKSGTCPEDMLKSIRDGNLLMQLSVIPESRRRCNFTYPA